MLLFALMTVFIVAFVGLCVVRRIRLRVSAVVANPRHARRYGFKLSHGIRALPFIHREVFSGTATDAEESPALAVHNIPMPVVSTHDRKARTRRSSERLGAVRFF